MQGHAVPAPGLDPARGVLAFEPAAVRALRGDGWTGEGYLLPADGAARIDPDAPLGRLRRNIMRRNSETAAWRRGLAVD